MSATTTEDTGAEKAARTLDATAAADAEIVVPKPLRDALGLPEKVPAKDFEAALQRPERDAAMLSSVFSSVQGEGETLRTVQSAATTYYAALRSTGKSPEAQQALIEQAKQNLNATVSASVAELKARYKAKDPLLLKELDAAGMGKDFDPSKLDEKIVAAFIEAEVLNQADLDAGREAMMAQKRRQAQERSGGDQAIQGGQDVTSASAPQLPAGVGGPSGRNV